MNIDLVLACLAPSPPPIHTLSLENKIVHFHLLDGGYFIVDGNDRYAVTDSAVIILRPAKAEDRVSRIVIPFDSIVYIESVGLSQTPESLPDGRG